MRDDLMDPIEALRTIRVLAGVAAEAEPENETPEVRAKRYAEHLHMILIVCDKALPPKRSSRRAKTPSETDPT